MSKEVSVEKELGRLLKVRTIIENIVILILICSFLYIALSGVEYVFDKVSDFEIFNYIVGTILIFVAANVLEYYSEKIFIKRHRTMESEIITELVGKEEKIDIDSCREIKHDGVRIGYKGRKYLRTKYEDVELDKDERVLYKKQYEPDKRGLCEEIVCKVKDKKLKKYFRNKEKIKVYIIYV